MGRIGGQGCDGGIEVLQIDGHGLQSGWGGGIIFAAYAVVKFHRMDGHVFSDG
jgi:hypothetical protein